MEKDSRKLRVAFLYDDSLDKADGVCQYVKTMGAWLSAQGHMVIYLVGETKIRQWAGSPVYSLSKNLRVNFNGNIVNTPLPANKKNIQRVLAKHELDVLHVQVPYSPLMAGRVIRQSNPKTAVVGTFHIYPVGFVASLASRLLGLVCGLSIRRFGTVLSVSPAAAEFAESAFGLKTLPSSNVVEMSHFKSAKAAPKQNHIVFLGRLVKRKGCMELLAAFKKLHEGLPQATLSIAGSGEQKHRLMKYVADNNLSSAVKFLGFINEEDKPDLLASAEIACFPSLGGESFGIVLIEAMAAGSGVVLGGDNPGYGSVLGDRPESLFNPANASELAAKLEKFLTDRVLAKDLHSWQQQEVRRYDIEVVGPQLVSLYERAIAKTRQKADN